MHKPLLSIIIPVYKAENTLEKCVYSITHQPEFDSGKIEIVLVDDGSPDHSGSLCDALAERFKAVRVIHQTNGGLSDARNTGIRHADGLYVQFLDADDYLRENSLQLVLPILLQEPNVVICRYCTYDLVHKTEQECSYHLKQELVTQIHGEALLAYLISGQSYDWYAWLYIVRRNFLTENGLFFEKGRFFEDILWSPQLLLLADRVAYLDPPVYTYVTNRSGTITGLVNEQAYGDKLYCLQYIKEFCRKNGFSPQTTVKMLANLSKVYVSLLADSCLLSKERRKTARKQLKEDVYILKYAGKRYQLILYWLRYGIGLTGVSRILHWRAQYIRRKKA